MTRKHTTQLPPTKSENSNVLQHAAVYKGNVETQSLKQSRFHCNLAETPVQTTPLIIQPKLKIGTAVSKANIVQRQPEGAPKGIAVGYLDKFLAEQSFGTSNNRTMIPSTDNTRANSENWKNPESKEAKAKEANYDAILSSRKMVLKNDSFERISIDSTDNNVLTGRYYEPKNTIPLTGVSVLMLSGSGGSSEEYTEVLAHEYCKLGITVLAMNYRGFGSSSNKNDVSKGPDSIDSIDSIDKTPSEKGLYEDGDAMLAYLIQQKGISIGNILVHGYSLGAPVAAEVVKRAALPKEKGGYSLGKVKGLVLDRAMPSIYKAVKKTAGPGIAKLAKEGVGRMSVKQKLLVLKDEGITDLPILVTSGGKKDSLSGGDKILFEETQKMGLKVKHVTDKTAKHEDHQKIFNIASNEINNIIADAF